MDNNYIRKKIAKQEYNFFSVENYLKANTEKDQASDK